MGNQTILHTILLLVILVFCGSCDNARSQELKTDQPEAASIGKEPARNLIETSLLADIRTSNIVAYGLWETGDDEPLRYLIRQAGNVNKLVILDSTGKVIYSADGVITGSIYVSTALRKIYPQLVFEYDEGGSDSYIQMLDLEAGEIKEKIETRNGENAFSGGVVIHPQYRSGVVVAKEPFEILLIDQGLPSPMRKSTKVLRYDGSKYRLVGTFDTQRIADFKEKAIVK